MKNLIVLGLMALTFLSCNSAKETKATAETTTETLTEEIFFSATGNEPFWHLTISGKAIVFKSLADDATYTFPYTEAIKAMDANVKQYRTENDKGKMEITITQKECINDMSGEASPYSVTIRFKKKTGTAPTYNGCGDYQLPQRFHDIWALEELNGKKVTLADFTKEIPYFEINAKEKSSQGYGGCNGLGGSLFYEPGVLRFERGMSTMRYCGDTNKENELYAALHKVTQYSFKDTHMVLSNPNGVLVVMKKVD
ncbi:META domain-containing protein [Flavobacterium sp.]|uniref:META domain-containing protein n=1 Tax=Flavobacterium sp. TaxID=239 RepID=UPI0028BDAA2B|nr:META domain-containing protein [Flavobacterium sp.]